MHSDWEFAMVKKEKKRKKSLLPDSVSIHESELYKKPGVFLSPWAVPPTLPQPPPAPALRASSSIPLGTGQRMVPPGTMEHPWDMPGDQVWGKYL